MKFFAGVATFCRVKSASSSCEVALPVAAEEGFTGLVNSSLRGGKNDTSVIIADGVEEYEKEELLRIDQEGRCVITDHAHFGINTLKLDVFSSFIRWWKWKCFFFFNCVCVSYVFFFVSCFQCLWTTSCC